MNNLKVWEGLAALDRVQEQVRLGTYEQPVYRTVQAVELLPEATTDEMDYMSPELAAAIFKNPVLKLLKPKSQPSYDYDAIAAGLKGLVF